MPVATCSTKAMNVALPNTYHQPVRGGTGCSSACRVAVIRPLRSSSQERRRRNTGRSDDGNGAGQDLDLPIVHPDRILRQRPGRRARRNRAVPVVDTAVAGTEKELGIGDPANRAAEMGAVDGEGSEL